MATNLTQNEINESIRYAALIQSALMPDIGILTRCFPESFIFFKPRDIVSGDFYWFHRKKNRIAVVAADCTGHGVPGAFMSVMGINFLNLISSHCIPLSNKILNLLREYVMKALNQQGYEPVRREGMDMSVCVFDLDQEQVEFSGAMNPLIYFKDRKLFQIKGDRMPVGANAIAEESFTRHILRFSDVDVIYLFSDGYPDQFGGPHEKKMKYKGFRNILSRIQENSFNKQHHLLGKELKQWIGNNKQIDDILIIGINLKNYTK